MKEPTAFVVALMLLVGAAVITRRYLGRDARIALGVIAAVTHLATVSSHVMSQKFA